MVLQARVSKELVSPHGNVKFQIMGIFFTLSPCNGREERYFISLIQLAIEAFGKIPAMTAVDENEIMIPHLPGIGIKHEILEVLTEYIRELLQEASNGGLFEIHNQRGSISHRLSEREKTLYPDLHEMPAPL